MPSKKPDAKVSCLCGFQVRVDTLSQERRVTCPSCGSTFDYVVTIDQASHAPRLSLILPKGALKPDGESLALSPSARAAEPEPEPEQEAEFVPVPDEPPPPPPKAVTRVPKKGGAKTIKGVIARCECGQDFPVEDNGELTSVQSCPVCDRAYHVVFKLSGGVKSAIIVPTKPIVHRGGEKLRSIVSKPPKGTTQVRKANNDVTTTDFFGPNRKGRTRVTKIARNTKVTPKPKAPVEIPAGAQAAPCACGETFIVRRKDVGQVLTCASCGAKSKAAEVRDPQTLAPIIRMKPV
jgi:hypothetical protein